jgi:hypothetical protein
MSHDHWLVALNLRGNMMGSKGIDAIITVLGHNETLSAIDFRPLPAQVRAKNRERRGEKRERVHSVVLSIPPSL